MLYQDTLSNPPNNKTKAMVRDIGELIKHPKSKLPRRERRRENIVHNKERTTNHEKKATEARQADKE